MTSKKRHEYLWEIGRRARKNSPKKLDANTIDRMNWARNHAKTEEEQDAANSTWNRLREHVLCAAGNYANYVLAPRFFADITRCAGDPEACVADYDCKCPVPCEEGAPICKEWQPHCRFKGLRTHPNALPNDKTGTDAAWWAVHDCFRRLTFNNVWDENPEQLASALRTIEWALRIANARRVASFGSGFDMSRNLFTV
jgi:hypothetical protein